MNKNGYTLVEFLAVIAIVTILATLGVTTYTNLSHAAKESDYEYITNLIKKSASDYFDDNEETSYVFVDTLIKQNYIGVDGKDINNPLDETKTLNCYLVSKDEEDNITLSDKEYVDKNGKCTYVDIRLSNDLETEINNTITKEDNVYLVLYDPINNIIYNNYYQWYIGNILLTSDYELSLNSIEDNYEGNITVKFDYDVVKNIKIN